MLNGIGCVKHTGTNISQSQRCFEWNNDIKHILCLVSYFILTHERMNENEMVTFVTQQLV